MRALCFSLLLSVLIVPFTTVANAQDITVPYYSHADVFAERGLVSRDGVAEPGPYGDYSTADDQGPGSIFFAHGYRWWGYPSEMFLLCDQYPSFDFPGHHSLTYATGCANPPIGSMAGWGGIIADPEAGAITSLVGASNVNGPTHQYCVPFGQGQICYPPPSTWGFISAYGYIRQAFKVESDGTLQPDASVQIQASITYGNLLDGDPGGSLTPVLFLNTIENLTYLEWMEDEYLNWGGVQDILGTPELLDSMLAYIGPGRPVPGPLTDGMFTDSVTATVSVGDVVVVETMLRAVVSLDNPGASGEAEAWAGTEPSALKHNYDNATNQRVRELVGEHGNTLHSSLTTDTPGALLVPYIRAEDTDNDGIADTEERGPDGLDNSYDGDADGAPDSQQGTAASLHTHDGQNYVTLSSSEGTTLGDVSAEGNPSPGDAPSGADFPYGFFHFVINGVVPGGAATVTLYLPQGESPTTYYKFGPTPAKPVPHWYEFIYDGQTGAEINDNVILLHFIDGQRGDGDLTADGAIIEPGAPAQPATAPFAVTSIAVSAESDMAITWTSEDGVKYQVQSKDNLADPTWADQGAEIVATGVTASWTDSTTGAAAQRFYRVRPVE